MAQSENSEEKERRMACRKNIWRIASASVGKKRMKSMGARENLGNRPKIKGIKDLGTSKTCGEKAH